MRKVQLCRKKRTWLSIELAAGDFPELTVSVVVCPCQRARGVSRIPFQGLARRGMRGAIDRDEFSGRRSMEC